jgi:3-hydroxy-9,10-secoandrosta-1,3,5(10)-triene-9,17-dione monooxygenase
MNVRNLTLATAQANPPIRHTSESVVAAIRELVPRIAARALETEQLRRVHPDTIRELHEAGLMRLMQPARFGGSELWIDDLMNVVFEIAKVCASTAWVYSNLASHSWNIGQFELQTQEDIWAQDPNALAATGLAFPCGKATPVAGGFQLSGRWPFCSGINASSWMLVGAMTEQDGGPPQRRFFLVPEKDFSVHDNWNTYGLTGTGSHDVEIQNAFVPAHRSVSAEVFAAAQQLPGAKLYDNPLYGMPTFAAFAYVLCGIPVATAKGAVEQLTAQLRQRAGTYTGARLAELNSVQMRIAEASACVEFAETVIRRDWQALEAYTRQREYPGMEVKLSWKRNAAFATQLAVRAVDALMPASGAGGLSAHGSLQRQFRDIHAASSHIALTWDIHGAAYGQSALGLPSPAGFLL